MSQRKPVERDGDREGPAVEREKASSWLLAFPRVKLDDPVGHLVLAAFRGAVSRIAASDPDARRGDSEGIHRLRTSTRRLRSELRALDEMVDRHWREPIEHELRWLAGLLGNVRDLDVLLARLHKADARQEPHDSGACELAPLKASLQARRDKAAKELDDGLQSDRYRSLLTALQRAAERPALADAAREPCRMALPPVAAAAWRRLKKGGRALRPSDPEEEFHELRKRAKAARYTAELIAPVLGRSAARGVGRFIRLTTQVQGTLGEHQDAIVSGREIEHALAEHPDDAAFVEAAGRLLETEHEAARAARAAFFKIWQKLDRKKTRRWMKTSQEARASA
jgi:CHAD domain-containing protein